MVLYLGCDPEVGIVKNGKLIPACTILRGKENPHKFKTQVGVVRIDHDGGAVEFQTRKETCLSYALDQVYTGLCAAASHAKRNGGTLFIGAGCKYLPEYLESPPPEILLSGCNTTYSLKTNLGPVFFREFDKVAFSMGAFFGCHVHIGFFGNGLAKYRNLISDRKKIKAAMRDSIRILMRLSGVPTALMSVDEYSKYRARFFGCGLFRPKDYGIEYKDIDGNALLTPMHAAVAFDTARTAIEISFAKYFDCCTGEMRELEKAIMGSSTDRKVGEALITRNRKKLLGIFRSVLREMKGFNSIGVYGRGSVGMLKNVLENYPHLKIPCVEKAWKIGGVSECHTFGFDSWTKRNIPR